MYTVKRAAEIVGVSSSTLRAWERRYAAASPQRSKGGYRLYDEQTVKSLKVMRDLIADGRTASEAAAIVLARRENPAVDLSDHGVLARSAADLDLDKIERALRSRFTAARFETTVDQWLMPALVEVGESWSRGEVSVAGEHMVAEVVRRELAAEYDEPRPNAGGPPVVIGLPPRARHELGILAFAAAARRRGLSTRYLGADVPAESWTRVAELAGGAVVLAIPRRADLANFERAHAAIRAVQPESLIAVGGALQEHAPDDCLRLGHEIGAAADMLAEELGLRPPNDG